MCIQLVHVWSIRLEVSLCEHIKLIARWQPQKLSCVWPAHVQSVRVWPTFNLSVFDLPKFSPPVFDSCLTCIKFNPFVVMFLFTLRGHWLPHVHCNQNASGYLVCCYPPIAVPEESRLCPLGASKASHSLPQRNLRLQAIVQFEQWY